jgi:hypothetical protein
MLTFIILDSTILIKPFFLKGVVAGVNIKILVLPIINRRTII